MENTNWTAKNLEDVLAILQRIIDDAKENNDQTGYFAALYHKVTSRVKEDYEKGQFPDGDRLAQLDVTFANRYFDAFAKYKNKQPISKSWQVAFDNCKLSSRLVLQHLLLGMNAHINFDLGIATVATSPGQIENIKNDFDSINAVLAALTHEVIYDLDVVSPLLSFLGFSGTKSNSMLVQFSMGNARDGSWCFAEDLAAVANDEQKYNELIAQRDTEIAGLGNTLVKTRGFLSFGIWLIHLFEWKNPRKIIELMCTYQKPYKKDLADSKWG